MSLKGNGHYVTTNEGLRDLMGHFGGAVDVAVDTEFMRERTYFAKLCLVQVSDGELSALIDPFEVDDLSPLFELLGDTSVTKVFHAGGQDLEIFWQMTGSVPTPVFDTQIAAALASFPLQAGYGLLVNELLGVELDKAHSYTDWSRRPLTERQLDYALDDVVYLPEVYRLLKGRLERDGRLDWLDPDFQELTDPASYEVIPEEMYRRVKRRMRLKRREMGILVHVAAWREREAMERDVPRNRIANDETLVQIASHRPQTLDELSHIRGLHQAVLRRSGKTILQAVRAGIDMPQSELPPAVRRPRGRMDVDAMTDLMSAVVRTRAREFGIAVPVLATRKEMEALARGEREDSPLLSGWKRSHIGEELVDLLDGRITLSVGDGEVGIGSAREEKA